MTSAVIQHLARYLSAIETRSGEAIAQELGCSRTAVWKHVEALRNLGIGIDAVAGRGYLLKEPLELLDADSILDFLDPATGARLAGLNIESSIDSTNIALQRLPLDAQHAVVILAEHQVAGRGRRGRQWASPYGRNLYLSLGWKLEKSMSELGCLPLVVALAVAQALSRAGLKDHRVKWPNDLLLDGRKLCGCLVEVQGDTHGPCHAVLGVGINVHMPASELTEEIDQPWTDLQSHIPGCSRNELAAWLIEELVTYLEVFASQGFTPMRELWEQLDDLKGQKVEVFSATGSVSGVSVGVDQTGALMLDTSDGVISLYSGDVTLRKPAQ
jgi:BirA family biotin operon repressor/biotin-[acetyl-CoA-carboxylase] ligase